MAAKRHFAGIIRLYTSGAKRLLTYSGHTDTSAVSQPPHKVLHKKVDGHSPCGVVADYVFGLNQTIRLVRTRL